MFPAVPLLVSVKNLSYGTTGTVSFLVLLDF